MTDKPNENEQQIPEPNETQLSASAPAVPGFDMSALNGLDLNALLQQQGITSSDLNNMVRQMMDGGMLQATTADDDEIADEDDSDEYDDEEFAHDATDDDDESVTSTVRSQQDVYKMAESLMSSPLMAQFSSLMGGPKMNEGERLFNQGKMLQGGGMLDEAAETFLDVIELDPQHFRAHVALGQVLLTMDRPTDAIPFLQKAEEIDPQDPGAPLYLGYAYYALEQYPACVEAFGRSVTNDPYNQLALNNLGFAQFLNGRLDEAAQTFVKAGDQGSDRAYYNLGMIRLLQDQTEAAWQAYDEAAELDPNGNQIEDHLQDLQKAYALYPERAAMLDQAAERLQATLAEDEYDDDESEYEEDYDDEADD